MKKFISYFSAIFLFILILLTLLSVGSGQRNTKTEITLLSYNAWIGGTNVNDGQSKH